MKAIVAEIDKKQMIVITDKGDFLKVKRQMSAGIGDEIELKPQKISLTYRRLASMAACFLVCILLSTGVYAYYTPYSYVSVDINPSIALSLNRFERVISVNPLNEDAVSLLEDTKGLKNQDIDDALSDIIKSATEKGYIDEKSENQVMVVVSAKNPKQEEELTDVVTTAAAKELSKVNKNSVVMVEKASVESYKAALSNKMSPGKEILADKLREVMPEIKDEEVRNMSVREVVHLIKEGKKAVMAADKDKSKEDKKGEEDYSATDTDKNQQKDKGAAKADSKAENDNKGSNKPKPSAAASKDNKGKNNDKDKQNPAALSKDNEGKAEKGEKSKAAEEGKAAEDDSDKDKEDEDEKKKDSDEGNDDKKGVENEGKHSDEADENDDSKGKDKDKEKNDGKK